MPILALWQFLGSPLGRAGMIVLACGVAAAGYLVWLGAHDRAVLAEQAAKEAAAVAETQIADLRRAVDAADAEARDATERAAKVTVIKTEIARAPVTVACVRSPAVAAALDGLRAAGGGNGPPGGAGVPVGMPAAAGPAGRPSR